MKPGILSVFGDVALAMGPEFKVYLDIVVKTLQQASSLTVDKVIRFVLLSNSKCLTRFTLHYACTSKC